MAGGGEGRGASGKGKKDSSRLHVGDGDIIIDVLRERAREQQQQLRSDQEGVAVQVSWLRRSDSSRRDDDGGEQRTVDSTVNLLTIINRFFRLNLVRTNIYCSFRVDVHQVEHISFGLRRDPP